MNNALQTPEYWDHRYQTDKSEAFDWFKSFEDIKELIVRRLAPHDKILVLGCGTSNLSIELYKLGHEDITNVDFSSSCIEQMKEKYSEISMEWLVRDVRDLHGLGGFQVCIDKGTFDALLSYDGSRWSPPDTVISSAGRYMDELARVLEDGGVFLWLGFTQPHFARSFLKHRLMMDVQVEAIGGSGMLEYFLYSLRKCGRNID